MANLSPDKALSLITSLLKQDSPLDHAPVMSLAVENNVTESKMADILADTSTSSNIIQGHAHFSESVLQLQPGQTALLSNGKVIFTSA